MHAVILGSSNCFNLDSSILSVVNCAAILCLISGMFWYINVSYLMDCVGDDDLSGWAAQLVPCRTGSPM